jgi:hypothetical protein
LARCASKCLSIRPPMSAPSSFSGPWDVVDDDWHYDLEKEARETQGLSQGWKALCDANMAWLAVGVMAWNVFLKEFGEDVSTNKWNWDVEKHRLSLDDGHGKRESFPTILVATQSSLSNTLVWGFQHDRRDPSQAEVIRLCEEAHFPEIDRSLAAGEGASAVPCTRMFDGSHASAVVMSLLGPNKRLFLHMIPVDVDFSGYAYILVEANASVFEKISVQTVFDGIVTANSKFTVPRAAVGKVFGELGWAVQEEPHAIQCGKLRVEFNEQNRISSIKLGH